MSMKRLAIIAAVSGASNSGNQTTLVERTQYHSGNDRERHHQGPIFNGNVNVLLSGAMLSMILTLICLIWYCCYRNLRKRTESIYRQRWLQATDPNMEIYSVEQCYDIASIYDTTTEPSSQSSHVFGPPPSYDTVVAMDQYDPRKSKYLQKCNEHQCLCINSECKQEDDGEDEQQCKQQSCEEEMNDRYDVATTSDDDSIADKNENVNNVNYRANRNSCCCNNSLNRSYEFVKICKRCGKMIEQYQSQQTAAAGDSSGDEQQKQQQQYCTCFRKNTNFNNYNSININNEVYNRNADNNYNNNNNNNNNNNSNSDNNSNNTDMMYLSASYNEPLDSTHLDANGNVPSTSSALINASRRNSGYGYDCTNVRSHNHNRNSIDLETFNGNGLIRMDMSQIIDHTGLPTYEAALKLESSGYV